MASDAEQKSVNVPQHKRIAMGVPLTGSSMEPKGGRNPITKPAGGLAQAKKK